MMSKGSRHAYGAKPPTVTTDTNTSNINSTFDKMYGDKNTDEGESESLLEKDIQVRVTVRTSFWQYSGKGYRSYFCIEKGTQLRVTDLTLHLTILR